MKETVTCSCGHEMLVELTGKRAERERKRAWYTECALCSDCYREKKQAIEKARGLVLKICYNYLELSSGKNIRLQFEGDTLPYKEDIKHLGYRYTDIRSIDWNNEDRSAPVMRWIKTLMAADAVAEVRIVQAALPSVKLEDGLSTYEKELLKDAEKASDTVSELEKEELKTDEALIVRPEAQEHSGYVTLSINNSDVIRASYPKDEKFREIIKAAHFTWSPVYHVWERNIRARNGSIFDRIADIAIELVKAGFAVLLPDKGTLEKVLHPESIAPEQRKWILFLNSNAVKVIFDRDETIYNAVKSLPWYRWDRDERANTVIAKDPAAIRDFAELYGFTISEKAEEVLKESERKLNKAITINIDGKKEAQPSDPLRSILDSPADVLPDLRDDL